MKLSLRYPKEYASRQSPRPKACNSTSRMVVGEMVIGSMAKMGD